jgi:hypothetical protein
MLAAGAAWADLPPLETAVIGGAEVSLWTLMFLDDTEAEVLRGLLKDGQALQGWLPLSGHGALAVAPDEGLWRDGARVPSVVGVGGMTSDEAASTAALAGCNALRQSDPPCIVVLQVAPK